jgi:hypothetical protein
LCCPAAPAVLRPPPTPSRLDATSRLSGYTHRLLPGRRPGAGEGLPSSRHHPPHVPRPLRREVPRRCTPGSSRLPWPSPCYSGLGSSLPLSGWTDDAAGFASCCGPHGCSPQRGS